MTNKLNWFQKIWVRIITSDNKQFEDKIEELNFEVNSLTQDRNFWKNKLNELQNVYGKQIEGYKRSIKALEADIAEEVKELELENYWNKKRKAQNYVYSARPVFLDDGSIFSQPKMDPRIFFSNPYDSEIPRITGESNDIIADRSRDYVARKITYKSEDKELWQFWFETWARKAGDCDDGAILMAMIMLKSGIPYWRIRINAGNVQGGGHAYVCYLREEDNEWYVMDWCYWQKESDNFGMPWKKAKKYYSDTDGKEGFGVWFSFNQKYIFGDLPKTEE